MCSTAVSFATFALAFPLLAFVGGCSGGDPNGSNDELGPIGQVESSLLPTAASGCDADATAGAGWVSTAMPSSSGAFSVTLRVTPELGAGAYPPVVDGVIGLSSGDASAYSDLGPAVRFNTNGTIDVRNGSAYAADQTFPYTFNGGPYEVRFDVDVPSHTYSVSVRHLDQVGKPMERLATNYAFRDEQQTVPQLDTVNRFVDGTQGGVMTCGFAFQAAPTATGAPHVERARALFVGATWRSSHAAAVHRR
jgi:hypothetical protein